MAYMNTKLTIVLVSTVAVAGIAAWQFGLFNKIKPLMVEKREIHKPEIVTEEKTEEKIQEVKKEEKSKIEEKDIAVAFKDLPPILNSDIDEDMKILPKQIQTALSIAQARVFLILMRTVRCLLADDAKKSGIAKDPAIQEEVNKRCHADAVRLYVQRLSTKFATEDAVKSNYPAYYDKKLVGKKSYNCRVVVTANEDIAKQFVGISAEEFEKKAKDLNNSVVVRTMNDMIEDDMFPELRPQLQTCKAKTSIGPVRMDLGNGQIMYCVVFVDSISEIKKEDKCPDKFVQEIKAMIVSDKINELLKQNKAKFLDLDGKEIDVVKYDEVIEGFKNRDLKNDMVVAKIGSKNITIGQLLNFFNIKKGVDDSAFYAIIQRVGNGNAVVAIYRILKNYVMHDVMYSLAEKEGLLKDDKYIKSVENTKDGVYNQEYLKKLIAHISDAERKEQIDVMLRAYNSSEVNKYSFGVKAIAFRNKQDAEKKLQEIKSGAVQFNAYFGSIEKHPTDDVAARNLGEVNHQGLAEPIFKKVASTKPGTCIPEVLQLQEAYAIIYVASKRELQPPSISNEQDRAQATQLAQVRKIFDVIVKLIKEKAVSIDGDTNISSVVQQVTPILIRIVTQLLSMIVQRTDV